MGWVGVEVALAVVVWARVARPTARPRPQVVVGVVGPPQVVEVEVARWVAKVEVAGAILRGVAAEATPLVPKLGVAEAGIGPRSG